MVRELSYGTVSLDEIDEGIRNSSSLEQLINNLQNLQRKQGGHNQLFTGGGKSSESNHEECIRTLRELNKTDFSTIRYQALEARFSDLPDVVRQMAKYIVAQHYENISATRPFS